MRAEPTKSSLDSLTLLGLQQQTLKFDQMKRRPIPWKGGQLNNSPSPHQTDSSADYAHSLILHSRSFFAVRWSVFPKTMTKKAVTTLKTDAFQ